jgi:hypothetical protein
MNNIKERIIYLLNKYENLHYQDTFKQTFLDEF